MTFTSLTGFSRFCLSFSGPMVLWAQSHFKEAPSGLGDMFASVDNVLGSNPWIRIEHMLLEGLGSSSLAACSVTVSVRLGHRCAADVEELAGADSGAADSQMTGVVTAAPGTAEHDILNTETLKGGGLEGRMCVPGERLFGDAQRHALLKNRVLSWV